MSAEVNKATLGAFVVGAIALFILGVVVLGGKKLFSQDIDYVLYFDGSVSGLNIGAPVVFRGVPMGNVTKISLVANAQDEGVTIPVYIRIDEGSIVRPGNEGIDDAMREEIIQRMVQRGLRARLQLQSLITGQYRVELDFFPDTPARYHSSDHASEIPTVASQLDQFQKALAKLPLESIVTTVNSALEGVARLVNSEDLHESIVAMKGALDAARQLLENLGPMQEEVHRVLSRLESSAKTIDVQLPDVLGSFRQAMGGFTRAASQLENVLSSTDTLVARDSRTVREFNRALKEFSDAARAVRGLAGMLERNPEALLRGKSGGRP